MRSAERNAARSAGGAEVSPVDLEGTPGHLIRRVQQIHKALWAAHVSEELTSPQYAVLVTLARESAIDQRTLGERVSLDRSTTADVVARLADRHLVVRVRDPQDRRRNLVALSAAGRTAMSRAEAGVLAVRGLLLEPLSDAEGRQLVRLLDKIVGHYRDLPGADA